MIRAFLLLLTLLAAAPAAAQQGRAAAPAPEPLTPLMWEIRKGDARVTLFGTVHALPRGVNWFRPHVVEALDAADVLVLETRVPDGPGMAPEMLRLARLSAPRPVLERVPPEWQARLNAELLRLKPMPLEWMKTWFIAVTLVNLEAERNGFSPAIGVEAVLTERARMRSRQVRALETLEEQLNFFNALSEADQQQLLIATIERMGEARARSNQLVQDWLAGRADALAMLVASDFERSPMLEQMLLKDRNERWAAWIAKEMQTPGHRFVAVGAGHFIGRHSVLEKLKRHGLEAQPVMPPPPPRRTPRRR
ncbi:MAG: TraB/GumN family protein [Thermaurantiacus sp.]